jgi:hypothetical protein
MYRAVAVLAGFVLLCGAVTAGTAALSGPRAERAVPSPVAVKAITGAEALQPDLLSSGGEIGRPPPGPDGDPRAPGTSRNPPSHGQAPRSLPQADPAAAGELALPPPPTTGQAPHKDSRDGADPDSAAVVNLVNTFYQTATVSPRDAFELLSPPLQGQGYLVFRQAWAGVRRATVEDIQQDGPSAALVSVRLEQQDSSVLHTRQHVLIIPGVAPRIAEVALLSASRS